MLAGVYILHKIYYIPQLKNIAFFPFMEGEKWKNIMSNLCFILCLSYDIFSSPPPLPKKKEKIIYKKNL